ncbi:MAG: response regulator [Gemmatimonadetes bacterium]|nr:response regulator [Gemmatimonadota bacterium]
MTPSGGPGRILVVEDDPGLGSLLSEELDERGFHVRTATSAEQAWETLEHADVDLIVSDLRLPGVGGDVLLAKVRQRPAAPAFIVITAFATVSRAVECLKAGADDFLTKPLDLEHLAVSVERALETRRLRELVARYEQESEGAGFHGLLGRSRPMRRVFDQVRALARSVDWAATPLGPVRSWSGTLRAIVRACLDSPFPISLWCGPELILIYNDGYRDVLGAKHPAALGRPGAEVWSEIWAQTGPTFEQLRRGGPPVYAEDEPFFVQRAGEGGAGAAGEPNAWFTFSLSAVRGEEGEIEGFLNIVSESTGRLLAERRGEIARARAERAEAQLLDVFAQAPAFMAVLRGPEHVFEYANNAYRQLVGDRDLLGRPVLEALPELRDQGFRELLDSVLEGGEPFVGREMPVTLARSPEGEAEQRFVDFVYYPISDAHGTRTGVVAHGSDVTEHVRARRDAQAARAEAEEANQAKSRFLTSMSHELRTPINAIIGYAELLELGITGPVSEAQRTQLERIRASSGHLLTLIDDILDLSRVEAGQMELTYERLPAADTVASAIALVAPQAEQRRIHLEDRCGDAREVCYVGDEDRVRQILANLLSNAVKFTPPGGRIRVECGASEPPEEADASTEDSLTYIGVTDTGIGIAAEEMENIFRPFTQADRSDDGIQGGTGLGLSISRHLAKLMGGGLSARSTPGEGSTFTLWLPSEGALEAPMEEATGEQTWDMRPARLSAVGQVVQERIPSLLSAFVDRMRGDADLPMAAGADEVDLVDHTSTFLADLSHSLITLENGTGPERRLRDGSEIQRLVAELHGRQRARLGWSPQAVAREWEILREVTEDVVLEALPGEPDLDGALGLLARLMERADEISRSSLRHATAAAGR